MGRKQGFNRLAQVIRGIGVLAAGLVLLVLWPLLTSDGAGENLGWALVVVVIAAICYFAGKAVAWVIEGFANEE